MHPRVGRNKRNGGSGLKEAAWRMCLSRYFMFLLDQVRFEGVGSVPSVSFLEGFDSGMVPLKKILAFGLTFGGH